MNQDDFAYDSALTYSNQMNAYVFHEETLARTEIAEDLRGAGYRIGMQDHVDRLLDQRIEDLGDVVVLDCAQVDPERMAHLSQLDMQLARSSTQLVVTTNLDNLDAVFACFDQTDPQILVDASRAERMVAVARCANAGRGNAVREMSDDERVSLARLSQQVDALAQRLEGSTSVKDTTQSYLTGTDQHTHTSLSEAAQFAARTAAGISETPPMPQPRHVRQVIRQRQARARFFDSTLFGDPAWDMLLDLTAAHGERLSVSVTSLCIASGVPATTALRWVKQMVAMGLFVRTEDTSDKRRAFIELSEDAAIAMARYFAEQRTGPEAV